MADVVKVTIFVTDITQRERVWPDIVPSDDKTRLIPLVFDSDFGTRIVQIELPRVETCRLDGLKDIVRMPLLQ